MIPHLRYSVNYFDKQKWLTIILKDSISLEYHLHGLCIMEIKVSHILVAQFRAFQTTNIHLRN